MKIKFIIISFFFSNQAFSVCNPVDIILLPNWVEDYRKECNIENKIAPKPTIQDDITNQNNFNTKVLASFLSTKIKQNLEEIASIETYYSYNDRDLGKIGGNNLLQSCTLNKLSEIDKKCGTKSNRIKELTKSLSGNDSTASLYGAAGNIFKKMRRIDIESNAKNLCPFSSSVSTSVLSSLFGDADKANILPFIEGYSIGSATGVQFDKIPLFSILPPKNREKIILNLKLNLSGSKNKNFDLDRYFASNEYTSELSKNLSLKCDSLFNTVEQFACDDNDVVSSAPEISNLMFKSNADSTKELNEQRHTAQCRAIRIIEDKKQVNSKTSNTLDKLLQTITIDRKPVTGIENEIDIRNQVCDVYNCKDSDLSSLSSCKKGGPVSSKELKNYCEENDCSPEVKNLITYLDIFEKEKSSSNIAGNVLDGSKNSLSNSTNTNNYSKPKMSTFLENFLGVEGTLSAQGIKPTPEAIAEKVAEFKEKGLDTTTSTSPVAQATPKATAQTADVRDAGAGLQNPNANSQANIVASNSNTDYHPLVSSSDASSSIPKVSGRNKSIASASSFGSDNGLNGTDSKSNDMQSMRKQLDEMLDTMKGASANEKLATISDNNGKYLPKSLGGDPTDNGLNEAERKRLADYRDNLNRWEKRLNDREWDITNRQGRSLSSSGNAQGSDGRQNQGPMEASNGGVNSDFSGSSEGRSKAVKLTSKSGDKGAKSLGSSDEATVSSDELTNLGKEKLKELGIDSKSPFMMKIVFNKKVYQVAVKMFNFRGKDILTPILSENNKDISKLVLGSPLFAEYRQYQLDRQKEKAAFSKMTE